MNTDVAQDDVAPVIPLEEHEGQDGSFGPPAIDDVRPMMPVIKAG